MIFSDMDDIGYIQYTILLYYMSYVSINYNNLLFNFIMYQFINHYLIFITK